jgi:hypothetical protein
MTRINYNKSVPHSNIEKTFYLFILSGFFRGSRFIIFFLHNDCLIIIYLQIILV